MKLTIVDRTSGQDHAFFGVSKADVDAQASAFLRRYGVSERFVRFTYSPA
jgi:hypothetical protein